ncbi:MAG: hypothetical protein ABIV28_02840 [Longimicrobiales bacterium]
MASNAEPEVTRVAGNSATAAIGIQELESAVQRLLSAHARMRSRAEDAEARTRALQDALKASSGEADAVSITDRLANLERENTELRSRLAEAGMIASRIAARIQFAEDER